MDEREELVEDLIASLAPPGGWLAANVDSEPEEDEGGAEDPDELRQRGDGDVERDRIVEAGW